MNCPLCDCPDCPTGAPCYRKPQPLTDFYPCPACSCIGAWRFGAKGYQASISEYQTQLEIENMINRSGNSSGNGGGRSAGRKRQQGLPFLTFEHLTFDKQPATILAARVQPDTFRKGPDGAPGQMVVVKVLLRSNTYLWNLRSNNPNLDVLCDTLGEDESAWANREISLFNEQDEFDNKVWMRVEVDSAAPAKKSKK